MIKSIYIGNLPFSTSSKEVEEMFEPHGEVVSVKLIYDKATGRPRGFGFVEMEDDHMTPAIEALHGSEYEGRTLVVNEAKEARRTRPSAP